VADEIRQLADLPALFDVPNSQSVVLARRSQHATARAKRDAEDRLLMSFKPSDFLSRLHIPQADRLIEAAGCQHLAIGRECNTFDSRLVAGHAANLLAGCRVPEPQELVVARSGEDLTVGRIRQVNNVTAMTQACCAHPRQCACG